MSFRLISATRARFEHAVVSLHSDGFYGEKLRALGVPVWALGMKRGQIRAAGVQGLRRIVREFQPDIVQTRLYHADLVGGIVARMTSAAPVVWGVHATELGALGATWKTRIVRRLCAWSASTVPTAAVCDARVTAQFHEKLGYGSNLFHVIPNGVDATVFRSDAEARERVRASWGVSPQEIAVGCVARWDPLKDHENLLRAVGILAGKGLPFRCVLVGAGLTHDNAQLATLIDACGARGRMILAGPTGDVPGAMNACDVHVLPSRSESQPVAIIEAMACATPCVVTDVGDSADIVGDTGWVVPPRSPEALAEALQVAMQECRRSEWKERGARCRERVLQGFTLERMAGRYADLWTDLHRTRQ